MIGYRNVSVQRYVANVVILLLKFLLFGWPLFISRKIKKLFFSSFSHLIVLELAFGYFRSKT